MTQKPVRVAPRKKVVWKLPIGAVDLVKFNQAQLGSIIGVCLPLRMVKGKKWCMTTYQTCWLTDEILEVAWRTSFVQ